MDSTITIKSASGSSIFIDFELKKIVFDRASGAEQTVGMLPMEVNFSDITDIELRNPGFLKAGGCNIIVNNTRYMTADMKNNMTFFATKDFANLSNALTRVLQECGLPGFKPFDSANAQKVIYAQVMKNFEKMKKCGVCGHVFCYSPLDVAKNYLLARQAKISRMGQLGNALGGSHIGATLNEANARNYESQIRDFNICPKCNSRDLVSLTKEEYEAELKAKNAPAVSAAPALSSADELKKFKDLLDAGIISQEEFDAKKKQLLGL